MTMLIKEFNRTFTVRRLAEFSNPKVANYKDLELPRGSVLYYSTADAAIVAPPQHDNILNKATKLIMMQHHSTLPMDGVIGRPILNPEPVAKDILHYHRINKRVRPLRNPEVIKRDEFTLLVENFSLLQRRYRYPVTVMSFYDRWHNNHLTLINGVLENLDLLERRHFIPFELSNNLPSIAKLRRAEKRRDVTSLAEFKEPALLNLLDLWTWLGHHRSHSLLSKLPDTELGSINIILTFGGRCINLNLGELNHWRRHNVEVKDDAGKILRESTVGLVDPLDMQKRLYKSILSVISNVDDHITELTEDEIESGFFVDSADYRDPDEDDVDIEDEVAATAVIEIDESEDFSFVDAKSKVTEVVVDLVKPVDLTKVILSRAEKHIATGCLSSKELKWLQEHGDDFTRIPDPYGSGVMIDKAIVVKPEDLELNSRTLVTDDTLLDPAMGKTTMPDFQKRYIKEILNKDMVSAVVGIQRGGVVLSEYTIDKSVDASGSALIHTIRVKPINGDPSTLRFTTPDITEEGYWTTNGNEYYMRKQTIDLPIRKVKDDTVALTSYYGKNFIKRSSKAVNNVDKWMVEGIIKRALNPDDAHISDINFGNVYENNMDVPRAYSMIAKELKGFSAGCCMYSFDYNNRLNFFKSHALELLEREGLTPIAKSATHSLGMDKFGNVFKTVKGGMELMGSLGEVLGFDMSKAPKEVAVLSMMGKELPLGLMLSYYFGLEGALKMTKTPYRVVPVGERVAVGDDIVIKMTDDKVIISPELPEQRLIFQGLLNYSAVIKAFSLGDMNGRDVYYNLIQKDKLTIRYLNELDLMDDMFVDPMTERILIAMNEPQTWRGLLLRSAELLAVDKHPNEMDANYMRTVGMQRIPGAVYTELVRAMRTYRNSPSSVRKIQMSPIEVQRSIASDPSVMGAEDANPIQSVKEADVLTFGGTGGRSRRSMVKRTRQYLKEDLGIRSGDSVDNGDVGITAYASADPILANLDGFMANTPKEELVVNQLISNCVQLAPGSLFDDCKY